LIEHDLWPALLPLVDPLEDLGIRHRVGGSVAGLAHGVGRSTPDGDPLAEPDQAAAASRVAALDEAYLSTWAAPLGIGVVELSRARLEARSR